MPIRSRKLGMGLADLKVDGAHARRMDSFTSVWAAAALFPVYIDIFMLLLSEPSVATRLIRGLRLGLYTTG